MFLAGLWGSWTQKGEMKKCIAVDQNMVTLRYGKFTCKVALLFPEGVFIVLPHLYLCLSLYFFT